MRMMIKMGIISKEERIYVVSENEETGRALRDILNGHGYLEVDYGRVEYGEEYYKLDLTSHFYEIWGRSIYEFQAGNTTPERIRQSNVDVIISTTQLATALLNLNYNRTPNQRILQLDVEEANPPLREMWDVYRDLETEIREYEIV